MYRLRLLGGASIEDDAGPLAGPPAQRHRLALLALLALHHPRGVPRRRLWELLWPGREPGAARNLLNQAVHQLRKALGARAIHTAGDELVLDSDRVECDVLAFREAREARETGRAVALHAGPFLWGFALSDAPEFERWAERERSRLERELLEALQLLAAEEAAGGDHRAAAALWRRCLRVEPCSERAVLGLMRSLAAAGDRVGALREAQAHAGRLSEALDAEPDPEVAALAARLRSGRPIPERGDGAAGPGVRAPDASDGARPLVGRRTELERLKASWRTAARRGAGFALIAGEAGIGKSRLAEAFLEWAARRGALTAGARSYAAEGRVPFGPVAEWLRSEALRASLRHVRTSWPDLAPLLPELARAEGHAPAPIPPEEWHRPRFFRALARAVLGRGGPRLLLIDDLQWCDSDTLQWLHFLLRFEPAARLMVLGTARLDEVVADHPLRALLSELERDERFSLTRIALQPLDTEETASLGAAEAGRPLDDEERERLYRETEGHPLFIVEGVRAGLLADPTGPSASGVASLPSRVRAVIRARLARLGTAALDVAGVAATVGREFGPGLVVRASPLAPEAVARGLDELVERRIVRPAGEAFDFTHDKLREVAYADLGPVRRRILHGRVAEALQREAGFDVDAGAGAVASHWEKAGDRARAVAFYRRAAKHVRTVHGYEEAAGYLQRALDLLDDPSQAGSEERARLELALEAELGDSLLRTRGWAAPEVAEAHARARSLAERLGDVEALCQALWGLQSVLMVRSELREAREVGQRLLTLAQESRAPVFMAAGHFTIGFASSLLGAFAAAADHLRQGIALFEEARPTGEASAVQDQVGILLYCAASQVAWHVGDAEGAADRERESRALAERLGSPFARTAALVYGALLSQYDRDRAAAEERATEAIALGEEFGFAHYLHTARLVRGWARAERGELRSGLGEIEAALDDYTSIGSVVRRPYFLGLEARVHRNDGRSDRALRCVARALARCEESGERWHEAELHRLRGELLLTLGADDEAEACRRRAIQMARDQGAVGVLQRIDREGPDAG